MERREVIARRHHGRDQAWSRVRGRERSPEGVRRSVSVHGARNCVQASYGKWRRRIGGIVFIFCLIAFVVQFRTAEQVAPIGVREIGKGF